MTTTDEPDRSPAPAVTRAAAILRLLADEGPLALSDISRPLHLAKSSTLNLLVALEQAELVRRLPEGYALGLGTVHLGGAFVRGFDIVREFARVCDDNPVLAPELLHLAVLHDSDALYLARHDGEHPWRLSARVGDRFPASITAVGSALLAELDDDQVRELYSDAQRLAVWTAHSVTSVDALLAKLHVVRERGWALDDRETNPGVLGMAVVVPPRRPDDVPMALGTSIVHHTSTPEHRHQVLEALLAARDVLATPSQLTRPPGDPTYRPL